MSIEIDLGGFAPIFFCARLLAFLTVASVHGPRY